MADGVFMSDDGATVVVMGEDGFAATRAGSVWSLNVRVSEDAFANAFSSVSDAKEAASLSEEARNSLSEAPVLAK